MKLAEALLQRAEYQKNIENLQQRILANVRVQEDESPGEDPNALLTAVLELNTRLCALVQQINRTNQAASLPDGQTLCEALAKRDMLLKGRSILSAVAEKANERDYRLTHAEIKQRPTVNVAALQKQCDDLSRQHRELDAMIQGANWNIELE